MKRINIKTFVLLFMLPMMFVGNVATAKKKISPKVVENRLPEDLHKLAGDPELLKKPEGLEVACYTFPNYHASALHNKIYSPGWTEYNLIRTARPWFEGHDQPRTPILGELDESLPSTWEVYNNLCTSSGIDVLIWDWYWYDGKPALHEALENGFLEASNNKDVKFACMWTNHPWYILYPTKKTDGTHAFPPSYDSPDFSYEEAYRSLSYIISRYFHLDNYWRIDNKPVICVWDAGRLESRLGAGQTNKLFTELREFAKKLGHEGIHFHVTGFGTDRMKELGYNTVGSYNPLDWAAGRFQSHQKEIADYGVAAADVAFKIWDEHYNQFNIPYVPGLGAGWDSTPRFVKPKTRPGTPDRAKWPACTLFENEGPEAFKAFVQSSFVYLNKHPEVPKFITIACFNEWSEGHYLLPDNRFGYGMLDALGEALGKKDLHTKRGVR